MTSRSLLAVQLIVLTSAILIEGSVSGAPAYPNKPPTAAPPSTNRRIIGHMSHINPDGGKIDDKGPFHVGPVGNGWKIRDGEKFIVHKGSQATVFCYADDLTPITWNSGPQQLDCSAAHRDLAQEFINASAGAGRGARIYLHNLGPQPEAIPLGSSQKEWLANILAARPERSSLAISINQSISTPDYSKLAGMIGNLKVDEDTRHLDMAELDALSTLYDLALDELDQVSNAGRSADYYIFHGDLNLATPSSDEDQATKDYRRAIALAGNDDALSAAVAFEAVGVIELGEEAPDEAKPDFKRARQLFLSLGDTQSAAAVDALINKG